MRIELPNDWRPRAYQRPLWEALESGVKRACAVCHRRWGKDLTVLNYIAVASQKRVGTYWHVAPTYAQGRKIIWDGLRGDGRRYLDAFPGWRNPGPGQFVTRVRDDEMKLWLANDSIVQVVGGEDPDRLVGPNPIGITMTEYSLQNPRCWEYIRPILMENDGWAAFIYTMRGKNHGYKLYQKVKDNPRWFTVFHTVDDTARISTEAMEPIPVTQERIQQEREDGMSEDMVQQEFYCSADSPLEGAIFGEILRDMDKNKQIGRIPYDPSLPVVTSWDLGTGSTNAIVFAQLVGREIRIIDYYENRLKGIDHYAKILREKPYVYDEHIAPHDIMVHEWGGDGKTRYEQARNFGIHFRIARKVGLQDGLNALRAMLPRCYINEPQTEMLLSALREYVYEKDVNGEHRTTPKKDWTNHACDAMRYLALGMRREKRASDRPSRPEIAIV